MTFLATYDGVLAPGYVDGHARKVDRDGSTYYDWPKPWALRCDGCGRVFEYGCVAMGGVKKLRPPTLRAIPGRDQHRCAFCEGFVEPHEQLAFEVAA